VPFILARPDEEAPGTVCDAPMSTLDIVPTCLAAAGIQPPDGLDGQAIPEDPGKIATERDLFWRWGKDSYAARSGDWKLLHRGGASDKKNCKGIDERSELLDRTCLFNLEDDPGESRDLMANHPAEAERLRGLYAEWSKDMDGKSNSRQEKDG